MCEAIAVSYTETSRDASWQQRSFRHLLAKTDEALAWATGSGWCKLAQVLIYSSLAPSAGAQWLA